MSPEEYSIVLFEGLRPHALGFPVGEEVRVDEVVDEALVAGFNALELDSHADAAIAPGHASVGVDVALRPGHPEADADLRAGVERTGGPDRNPAATEVERERRRDRVAEPVLDGDAEDDPRTATAVEIVGEQMRRE